MKRRHREHPAPPPAPPPPQPSAAPPPPATVHLPFDEQRFPALCELVRRGASPEVIRELRDLAISGRAPRAPRLSVFLIAHLLRADAVDPVLLKDISRSGVRFLIPVERAADLPTAGELTLRVATSTGFEAVPLVFVRVCGRDEKYLDVAAQFTGGDLTDETLASLRSYFFDLPRQRSSVFLAH